MVIIVFFITNKLFLYAEEKVEISGVTSIREGNKKNFSAFLDKTTLNNNDQSHLNEPTGTPLNV